MCECKGSTPPAMGVHLALAFQKALRRFSHEDDPSWSVNGLESVVTNDVMLTAQWRKVADWFWRKSPHINVLEVAAGVRVLSEVGLESPHTRFLSFIDSAVARGALSKGRSTSRLLQPLLRKSAVFEICFDLYPVWPFCPTRLNVADDPTREVDLRAAVPNSIRRVSDLDFGLLHRSGLKRSAANWIRLLLLVTSCQAASASSGFSAVEFRLWTSTRLAGLHFWIYSGFGLCGSAPCSVLDFLSVFAGVLGVCLVSVAYLLVLRSFLFRPGLIHLFGLLLCPLGPLQLASSVDFRLGALAMEPSSAAERRRADARAGAMPAGDRVALDATRSWLVAYGQELYRSGKAYGIYAETVNSVASARPQIRKQLAVAWDFAYSWIAEEPFGHHPALPASVLLALMAVAILWGWLTEAAVFGLAWCGILRIGEVLQATRADLVLPRDAVVGTPYALLKIREPKTRGRHAKHQAARVDPTDIVMLLDIAFSNKAGSERLWPLSAATLRRRFGDLMKALKLPQATEGRLRPFDLSSFRPGGASHLLNSCEDSEVVRRRGRWATVKTMEIYLQEVLYVTYVEKLPAASKEIINIAASSFPDLLQKAKSFVEMLRLGELKVEQQVLQDDLKDQTEAQKENTEFAAALKKTCEEKEKAWSQYQASQAEELQALTETVDFLSKDQVRDTLRDATSTALLSRARTTADGPSPVPAAALSFMQVSESEAMGDSLEQALRGQGGRGMEDVLRHIDDLHDVLDKEQASDEDRQKYCETKLRQVTAAKSNKQREVEDAQSIIATYQNELDTVVGQIGSLKARMEDLDKQVAKTTSARQAERTAFEKSRDTNHAALELLEVAEKRLERFYAVSLVQAEKAQDTSSSLAASRSRSPPPTADLSYQTQGGGATRVLQLFNTIKADVQKQNAMLESEDAIGQSEYENLVKNSNEKKMADNRSLGSKEAAKAELEADLQRSRQGLRSLNEVLTALDEEIRTLHKQCDFLLKNFDLREDARRAEKRSLTRAKAVLEAAA
eukprot:s1823_g9.t1